MTRDELQLVLLTGQRLGFADAASAMMPGGGYRTRAVAHVIAALATVADSDVDPLVIEVIKDALAEFRGVPA